jgi:hypothetical protein
MHAHTPKRLLNRRSGEADLGRASQVPITLGKRHVQSSRHRSELKAADPPAGYGAGGHAANAGTGSRGLDCNASYDDQGKRVTLRPIHVRSNSQE